jgi:lipopolysaccharide/colanic/teichoic acid biosynthesis glycosyltransferase
MNPNQTNNQVAGAESETDKRINEMARESYLMRREIAIIAGVFFLALIAIIMFAIGSMTQVNLPV